MVVSKSDLLEGVRAMRNVGIALFLLFLLKFVTGVITHAHVLVADALHSLVDFSAILAVLVGMKLATKPPSERFPYGYYKAESLAALFVSLIILYGAYELVLNTIRKWGSGTHILSVPIAALMALVSAVISYAIARYEERIADLTNSDAIRASSRESLLDVFSSVLVLISVLLSGTSFGFVESIVTVIISLLVIKIGLENVYMSILALMDVSPSKEMEKRVRETIEAVSGVVDYRDLRLRRAGPFILGEVTVTTHPKLNIEEAHEVADTVEKRVRENVPQIEHFVVHVEPQEKNELKIVVPVEENAGMKSRLAKKFSRAEGFVVVEVDKKSSSIKLCDFLENLQKQKKIRAGVAVAKQLLKSVDFDVVLTKEIGEIAYYTLRTEGKDVYRVSCETVGDAVRLFLEGKVERMERPTKEKV